MTLKCVVLFPYLGQNKLKDFHFKARIDDPASKVLTLKITDKQDAVLNLWALI